MLESVKDSGRKGLLIIGDEHYYEQFSVVLAALFQATPCSSSLRGANATSSWCICENKLRLGFLSSAEITTEIVQLFSVVVSSHRRHLDPGLLHSGLELVSRPLFFFLTHQEFADCSATRPRNSQQAFAGLHAADRVKPLEVPWPSADAISCMCYMSLMIFWADLLYEALLLEVYTLIGMRDLQPLSSNSSNTTNAYKFKNLAALEFSVLNRVQWRSQLRQFLNFSTNGTLRPSHVVFTLSNAQYMHGFSLWYNMTRSKSSISVIVALDAKSCAFLASGSQQTAAAHDFYLCTDVPETMKRAFVDTPAGAEPIDLMVGLVKILAPLVFLSAKLDSVFSEMDVFWRKDPRPDLFSEANHRFDIQVSPHVILAGPVSVSCECELNIGLYYVRTTSLSKTLFDDMLSFVLLHAHYVATTRTSDQKLFDHAIRASRPSSEEPPIWGEQFLDLRLTNRSTVWRRLPGDLYTHNIGKVIRITDQVITMHISWGVDPPARRTLCAAVIGFLSSPKHAAPKKPCFD